MAKLVGTFFFLVFFLLVIGLFLKFFLESNHAIERVVRKNGSSGYRQYKREEKRKKRTIKGR